MARNGQKRVRERIPKAERRNLRLWAEGQRELVLKPHLEAYSKALDGGWSEERKYIKKVQKEFHARIDWQTPDHEEPVLKDFDPKQVLPPVVLEPAEEVEMQSRKKMLNARIRRWFMYRVRKFRHHRTGAALDPTKDPYAVFLAKLSGVTAPPKARQAFQQFMHESYAELIAPAVAEQWAAKREEDPGNPDLKKEPKAGFRAQVARELFRELDKDAQAAIGLRAKEEGAARKEAYQAAMKSPPSQAPADRQRCIDALPDFAGPILRGIQEMTGLHAVLVFGGPMPKYGGALRTLHQYSVAYGRNRAAVSQSWPQWDKKRFGEQVVDFMTEYLQTAFNSSDEDSSDTSSDDSEDEDSGDEPNDSDEEQPARKKRKVAAGKKAVKASSPPVSCSSSPAIWRNADGLMWDQQREANRKKNAALAAQIVANFEVEHPELAKAQPKKRPRKKPASTNTTHAPTRKSHRLGTGTSPSNGEDGATTSSFMTFPSTAPPTTSSARSPTTSTTLPAPSSTAPTTTSSAPATTFTAPSPTTSTTSSTAPETTFTHATTFMPATTFTPATTSTAPPSTTTPATTSSAPPSTTTPATTSGATPTTSSGAPATTSSTAPATSSAAPAATSSAAPPTTSVPCPPKAAVWFADMHAQMTARNLGPHYDAVVAAWTRIEAASKYAQGPTNLPKKLRPDQVNHWIARARKSSRGTSVLDPAAYALVWQDWWDSLQPSWRTKEPAGTWAMSGSYGPDDGEAWGALFQWGINGVLSIVASLQFWGLAIQDVDEAREAWENATSDVAWVLEGLAAFYEKFNRRF
ncbi:hypothetical protein C8R46DRAFT_1046938 [Mycena filopes]|nr:hypothetical protein C8R46DRAFT_1046938 [Mycena filopes]